MRHLWEFDTCGNSLETGVDLEFVLEIEFEFVIESEFQFKFEIERELEFAFALEFGFQKLTFGSISIPRSLKFALRDLLDRSPWPPHSPTGECARRHPGRGPKMTRRHPGKGPKKTTLSN